VLLIGPCHRLAFSGLAVSGCAAFETPVGTVGVDEEGVQSLIGQGLAQVLEAAHEGEHALEVHLPFLIAVLGGSRFDLTPVVVGEASAEQTARAMEPWFTREDGLVVVSTDLSHYLPYDTGRELDTRTTQAITELAPHAIARDQACGRTAVQAALILAQRHGLRAVCVDQRSSGDTSRASRSWGVVGYGAYLLGSDAPPIQSAPASSEPDQQPSGPMPQPQAETSTESREPATHSEDANWLTPGDRAFIRDLAERAVVHAVRQRRPLETAYEQCPPGLWAPGACFVTLHRRGELRGCIGSLEPRRPLAQDVAHNAGAAALRDPRFPAVRPDELAGLDVEVSVLGPARRLSFTSEHDLLSQLRPGVDGVIIEEAMGERRATFLPAVWQSLPEPSEFIRQLLRKGGMESVPITSLRVSVYATQSV
jgi:AmmeMemoRadiSam system protein A/AmmeMemoRadiSam system protein B